MTSWFSILDISVPSKLVTGSVLLSSPTGYPQMVNPEYTRSMSLSLLFHIITVNEYISSSGTEACSCRLQQFNLSGSLSIHNRQGLASRPYLGGGRRWTGQQTNLSCCTTSHSKLHIASFLSFLTITCVALPIHFPLDKWDHVRNYTRA